MSGITIEGVNVPLGEGRALVVEHLAVGTNEHLVLFGPNGAGKSTLLRLIAGTLGGGPAVPAAYLPQRPVLFRGSARWNLHLGLDPHSQQRAMALSEELGITAILEDNARTLSGGERQRLALARTLARSDQLVLLDEPLSALDAADRAVVASIINRELRDRTAIVVTHDREEAALLGQRMAVLVRGAILQIGSVEEVFSLPVDGRVADAVGIGNVLRGTVVDSDGGLAAIRTGPLVVWGVGDAEIDSNAFALFGAEAVTVFAGTTPPSGSARNAYTGTVTEIRNAGRLVELVVDCGVKVAALVTPGSLEALGTVVGSEVVLMLKATAVRIVVR